MTEPPPELEVATSARRMWAKVAEAGWAKGAGMEGVGEAEKADLAVVAGAATVAVVDAGWGEEATGAEEGVLGGEEVGLGVKEEALGPALATAEAV